MYSLKGAQVTVLQENGQNRVIKAKGKSFRIGSFLTCDFALDHPEAKDIHCEITCDPFGRVSLKNHCKVNPVKLDDAPLKGTRRIFDGAILEIFDVKLKWECKTEAAGEATAQNDNKAFANRRTLGQAPNSEPKLRMAKQGLNSRFKNRLTMHNLGAFSLDSSDDDIESENIENDENLQADLKREAIIVATSGSGATPPRTSRHSISIRRRTTDTGSTPKNKICDVLKDVNLNREEQMLTPTKQDLSICNASEMVITSYSPSAKEEKSMKNSFTGIKSKDTSPDSKYGTPNGTNDDFENSSNVAFGSTTPTSKRSMYLIDFTTPEVFRTPSQKSTTPLLKSALKNFASKSASKLYQKPRFSLVPEESERSFNKLDDSPNMSPRKKVKRSLSLSQREEINLTPKKAKNVDSIEVKNLVTSKDFHQSFNIVNSPICTTPIRHSKSFSSSTKPSSVSKAILNKSLSTPSKLTFTTPNKHSMALVAKMSYTSISNLTPDKINKALKLTPAKKTIDSPIVPKTPINSKKGVSLKRLSTNSFTPLKGKGLNTSMTAQKTSPQTVLNKSLGNLSSKNISKLNKSTSFAMERKSLSTLKGIVKTPSCPKTPKNVSFCAGLKDYEIVSPLKPDTTPEQDLQPLETQENAPTADEESAHNSTFTIEESFDNLVGRPSIKKTYSKSSPDKKSLILSLNVAESSVGLVKTDVEEWVENVAAQNMKTEETGEDNNNSDNEPVADNVSIYDETLDASGIELIDDSAAEGSGFSGHLIYSADSESEMSVIYVEEEDDVEDEKCRSLPSITDIIDKTIYLVDSDSSNRDSASNKSSVEKSTRKMARKVSSTPLRSKVMRASLKSIKTKEATKALQPTDGESNLTDSKSCLIEETQKSKKSLPNISESLNANTCSDAASAEDSDASFDSEMAKEKCDIDSALERITDEPKSDLASKSFVEESQKSTRKSRKTMGDRPVDTSFDLEAAKERYEIDSALERIDDEPKSDLASKSFVEESRKTTRASRKTMGDRPVDTSFDLEAATERYEIDCALERVDDEPKSDLASKSFVEESQKSTRKSRKTMGDRPVDTSFDLEAAKERYEIDSALERIDDEPKSDLASKSFVEESRKPTRKSRKTMGDRPVDTSFDLEAAKERNEIDSALERIDDEPKSDLASKSFVEESRKTTRASRKTMGDRPVDTSFDLEAATERYEIDCALERVDDEPKSDLASKSFVEESRKSTRASRKTMGDRPVDTSFDLEAAKERYEIDSALEMIDDEPKSNLASKSFVEESQKPTRKSRKTMGDRPVDTSFDLEAAKERYEIDSALEMIDDEPKSNLASKSFVEESQKTTRASRKTMGDRPVDTSFDLEAAKERYEIDSALEMIDDEPKSNLASKSFVEESQKPTRKSRKTMGDRPVDTSFDLEAAKERYEIDSALEMIDDEPKSNLASKSFVEESRNTTCVSRKTMGDRPVDTSFDLEAAKERYEIDSALEMIDDEPKSNIASKSFVEESQKTTRASRKTMGDRPVDTSFDLEAAKERYEIDSALEMIDDEPKSNLASKSFVEESQKPTRKSRKTMGDRPVDTSFDLEAAKERYEIDSALEMIDDEPKSNLASKSFVEESRNTTCVSRKTMGDRPVDTSFDLEAAKERYEINSALERIDDEPKSNLASKSFVEESQKSTRKSRKTMGDRPVDTSFDLEAAKERYEIDSALEMIDDEPKSNIASKSFVEESQKTTRASRKTMGDRPVDTSFDLEAAKERYEIDSALEMIDDEPKSNLASKSFVEESQKPTRKSRKTMGDRPVDTSFDLEAAKERYEIDSALEMIDDEPKSNLASKSFVEESRNTTCVSRKTMGDRPVDTSFDLEAAKERYEIDSALERIDDEPKSNLASKSFVEESQKPTRKSRKTMGDRPVDTSFDLEAAKERYEIDSALESLDQQKETELSSVSEIENAPTTTQGSKDVTLNQSPDMGTTKEFKLDTPLKNLSDSNHSTEIKNEITVASSIISHLDVQHTEKNITTEKIENKFDLPKGGQPKGRAASRKVGKSRAQDVSENKDDEVEIGSNRKEVEVYEAVVIENVAPKRATRNRVKKVEVSEKDKFSKDNNLENPIIETATFSEEVNREEVDKNAKPKGQTRGRGKTKETDPKIEVDDEVSKHENFDQIGKDHQILADTETNLLTTRKPIRNVSKSKMDVEKSLPFDKQQNESLKSQESSALEKETVSEEEFNSKPDLRNETEGSWPTKSKKNGKRSASEGKNTNENSSSNSKDIPTVMTSIASEQEEKTSRNKKVRFENFKKTPERNDVTNTENEVVLIEVKKSTRATRAAKSKKIEAVENDFEEPISVQNDKPEIAKIVEEVLPATRTRTNTRKQALGSKSDSENQVVESPANVAEPIMRRPGRPRKNRIQEEAPKPEAVDSIDSNHLKEATADSKIISNSLQIEKVSVTPVKRGRKAKLEAENDSLDSENQVVESPANVAEPIMRRPGRPRKKRIQKEAPKPEAVDSIDSNHLKEATKDSKIIPDSLQIEKVSVTPVKRGRKAKLQLENDSLKELKTESVSEKRPKTSITPVKLKIETAVEFKTPVDIRLMPRRRLRSNSTHTPIQFESLETSITPLRKRRATSKVIEALKHEDKSSTPQSVSKSDANVTNDLTISPIKESANDSNVEQASDLNEISEIKETRRKTGRPARQILKTEIFSPAVAENNSESVDETSTISETRPTRGRKAKQTTATQTTESESQTEEIHDMSINRPRRGRKPQPREAKGSASNSINSQSTVDPQDESKPSEKDVSNTLSETPQKPVKRTRKTEKRNESSEVQSVKEAPEKSYEEGKPSTRSTRGKSIKTQSDDIELNSENDSAETRPKRTRKRQ